MMSHAWFTVKNLALFIWPKEKLLQLLVILCFFIIATGRVINYYSPICNKQIVDSIDITSKTYRLDLVFIYVGMKFLQRGATGGIGLLNNLRTYLWTKIQQNITRNIDIKLFKHLHGLSLRWRLSRKTGEISRIIDRGIDSINKLLDNILFSILPTILDVIITVIYLTSEFSIWLGLIVLTTVILYIFVTIYITKSLSEIQKRKNQADNDQKAHFSDSLFNFEIVKYYAAESIEVKSYEEALLNYQNEEWNTMKKLNVLNIWRNIIVTLGLLTGSIFCLEMVVKQKEQLTIGDYVLFSTSILQLYVPLNSFGTYYGAVQQNYIDMENMFDLFRETQDIKDSPLATPLKANTGRIEFSNVSFSYTSEKPILKNLNFVVQSGKTVALVGRNSAGKSTIMRLILRLYDVNDGAIIIDEQDIQSVKQDSLRETIGVVPQNTVLFNNTIRYNIQYGKIGASEDEVIAAAKYADIHDQILKFPNGYDTMVGELGSKLSGGEKQRIVIALTIIKNPKIIFLDEATSALDIQTQRNIQFTLNRVCANRTTLIITHRLSTIIHADEILVLKEGEIVERGKHKDLIDKGGHYYDLWKKELKNEIVINDETKS